MEILQLAGQKVRHWASAARQQSIASSKLRVLALSASAAVCLLFAQIIHKRGSVTHVRLSGQVTYRFSLALIGSDPLVERGITLLLLLASSQ